ncbi:hypothetical protein, partial [Bradyrhizobium sp. 21]|uniref:hypothetical protein n=1 Tax=Bradyrhizobium sp. 21 TaxID=2782666 RepID=UPI001FF9679A
TATTDDAPALEGYHGHGVFTYALLDAMDHADVNNDGLIEISELADYIDRKVPDYSFEAFNLRQIPQRSIVGNNFALINRTSVLRAVASNGGPAEKIPGKPTHVIIKSADVFAAAEAGGEVIDKLPVGAQVSIMPSIDGWVLVVRNGKRLGYTREQALLRLQ